MEVGKVELSGIEWARYQKYLTSVHTKHNGHWFRLDFNSQGDRYAVSILCNCGKPINITEA